jgi:hypothetical protein
MDLFVSLLICVPLLLIAAGMIVWHVRAWRSFKRRQSDAGERNYRWRQFRRRMQTSVMLALLAVAFPVGDVLTMLTRGSPDWGIWVVVYWMGTILLACWIVLLGLVDIWATRHYFGRLHNQCFVEQIKLEAELRRTTMTQQRNNNGGST